MKNLSQILSIIISIIIAASGFIWGSINNSFQDSLNAEIKRIDKMESIVYSLQQQNAVLSNELIHINDKLDTIIKLYERSRND